MLANKAVRGVPRTSYWRPCGLPIVAMMAVLTTTNAVAQLVREPAVTLRAVPESPEVGEPFWLEIEVDWSSSEREGLSQPPVVEVPDSVQRGPTAVTALSGGRTLYRVELLAGVASTIALGPVEVRYVGGSSGPGSLTIPAIEVEIRALRSLVVVPLGLAGAGLAVAGGIALRRRRSVVAVSPPGPTAADLLTAARRRRTDGDVSGFLAGIEEALAASGGAGGGALARELEALVERVRFGGKSPSRDELVALEREAERRVTEHESNRES